MQLKPIIMKNGIFLILALVLLTACENSTDSKEEKIDFVESKKGAWSDADKQSGREYITGTPEQSNKLGKYKQEFIDCFVEKVEANYSSFDDAKSNDSVCEILAYECANEIIPNFAIFDQPNICF